MLESSGEVLLIFDERLHLCLVGFAQVFLFLVEAVNLLLEVADLPIQLLNLLLRQLFVGLNFGLKRENFILEIHNLLQVLILIFEFDL